MGNSYVISVYGKTRNKAAAATLPAPTSTLTANADFADPEARYPRVQISEGVDVRDWGPSGRQNAGYPAANVTLFADGASTVTNAELWGFDPVHCRWGLIQALDASITLSTTRSYFKQINLPTVFSHLCVVATISASNVGYQMTPIATGGT